MTVLSLPFRAALVRVGLTVTGRSQCCLEAVRCWMVLVSLSAQSGAPAGVAPP